MSDPASTPATVPTVRLALPQPKRLPDGLLALPDQNLRLQAVVAWETADRLLQLIALLEALLTLRDQRTTIDEETQTEIAKSFPSLRDFRTTLNSFATIQPDATEQEPALLLGTLRFLSRFESLFRETGRLLRLLITPELPPFPLVLPDPFAPDSARDSWFQVSGDGSETHAQQVIASLHALSDATPPLPDEDVSRALFSFLRLAHSRVQLREVAGKVEQFQSRLRESPVRTLGLPVFSTGDHPTLVQEVLVKCFGYDYLSKVPSTKVLEDTQNAPGTNAGQPDGKTEVLISVYQGQYTLSRDRGAEKPVEKRLNSLLSLFVDKIFDQVAAAPVDWSEIEALIKPRPRGCYELSAPTRAMRWSMRITLATQCQPAKTSAVRS